MGRTQLTPELLEQAEWFCEFGLLVLEVSQAHSAWTLNQIAQEMAYLLGMSDDEMLYWVGLVFQVVETWQQKRQERSAEQIAS